MKSVEYYLKQIKKRDWYRQGGNLMPFLVAMPYMCIYPAWGEDSSFVFWEGSFKNWGYFDKNLLRQYGLKQLKAYLANPNYLKNQIKSWEKSADKVFKLLDLLLKANDPQFGKVLKAFNAAHIHAWSKALVLEAFDPWGHTTILEYAAKYQLTDEELAVMTAPSKFSYLQRELLDRVKILQSYSLVKVKKHYHNYYWIDSSWQQATLYTLEDFIERFKKSHKKLFGLKKEVLKIVNHFKQDKILRKKLIAKYKFDQKTLRVFNFFQELNDWRDYRKQVALAMVNYQLKKLQLKLAKINNLPIKVMEYGTLLEIDALKLNPEYVKKIKARDKTPFIFCNYLKGLEIYEGAKAEKLINSLHRQLTTKEKEVKGRSAYKGKVVGKVKILNNIKEISKMKKGDVLVSVMTRPELVAGIKKASAIVTDEGGITCHAAIISRELKIPCIVGTQTATHIFKDGDLVEVDAERGVVKKL